MKTRDTNELESLDKRPFNGDSKDFGRKRAMNSWNGKCSCRQQGSVLRYDVTYPTQPLLFYTRSVPSIDLYQPMAIYQF